MSRSICIYSFAVLFDIRNQTSFKGGLGFWFVGYGLAFGEGNNGVIGTSYFAAIGLPLELYTHLFFQVANSMCYDKSSSEIILKCDIYTTLHEYLLVLVHLCSDMRNDCIWSNC